MSKDNQALWSYIINYGPDGEENYAYVYTPDGEVVGNLKIHHARAIVGGLNEALTQAAVPDMEPVGEAGGMPGSNGGFTMAAFEASKVPLGTKLYSASQLSALQERVEAAERERDEAMGARNENAKLRGQRDAALAKLEAAEANFQYFSKLAEDEHNLDIARAETAEARVAELEAVLEALTEQAEHVCLGAHTPADIRHSARLLHSLCINARDALAHKGEER